MKFKVTNVSGGGVWRFQTVKGPWYYLDDKESIVVDSDIDPFFKKHVCFKVEEVLDKVKKKKME